MANTDQKIEEIMKRVLAKMETGNEMKNTNGGDRKMIEKQCALTEFVGATEFGDTIGLVIANVDSSLLETMKLEKKYRSIGIVGARTCAGPHIMAADEATNTEVILIEMPRDTKGGAGHGSIVIFGGDDVSDVKRAVEVTLKEVDTRTFGDVYGNEAGHIECQYTARASYACNKVFGAPVGKAFGILVGAPAAIGVVMADTALKSANVDVVSYATPQNGQSFSNEVTMTITGDSGAVRQAIISARDIGCQLLGTMGSTPKNDQPSYI
jgi:microcompartment protein PduB